MMRKQACPVILSDSGPYSTLVKAISEGVKPTSPLGKSSPVSNLDPARC
jgi:hypothetical protein